MVNETTEHPTARARGLFTPAEFAEYEALVEPTRIQVMANVAVAWNLYKSLVVDTWERAPWSAEAMALAERHLPDYGAVAEPQWAILSAAEEAALDTIMKRKTNKEIP